MATLKKFLPLIVVAAAFLWACITIALQRREQAPPGAIVIRIGHFQLESGVRDAFDKLAKDFASLPEIKKLGDVRVVQEAVPESLYGQWLTSQMMAQQPPDLVEVGMMPAPTLLAFQNRYFVPLNDLAAAPNPFNIGANLEGIPLKDTLSDSMRSGYQEELQAYMRVPLARFSQKLFYNKTLLRKLTGLEKPPSDLPAFLALCHKINALKTPDGQPYVAIASSTYHAQRIFDNMADPLSYANLFTADFTRDGAVGTDETYAAFASHRMSLNDPPWRARLNVVKDLSREFQPGFVGASRDEALFIFAQQKGVFICTGTWDVNSLVEQASGIFEVGIANFPIPAPDDPQLGRLIFGPIYDPAGPGFPFGITRFSHHPDVARLFLLYLASVKGNAELNRIIGWIPSVVGAPIPPALVDFKPVEQGMTSCGNVALGGKSLVKWNQYYTLFQSDPNYSLADLERDFSPAYIRLGREDWDEQQRDWRRGILLTEQTLAALRGEALLNAPDNLTDPKWLRYRSALVTRQAMAEVDHRWMQEIVDHGPQRPVGPYSYLPAAFARARRTFAPPPAGGSAP